MEKKIKAAEYEKEANAMLRLLPAHIAKLARVVPPWPRNYQITYRVRGGYEKCELFRDHPRDAISARDYQIRSVDVKVAIQLSPQRKAALTSFYSALQHVDKYMTRDYYDSTIGNCEIFTEPDVATIGKWNKDTANWDWCSEVGKSKGAPMATIQEIKKILLTIQDFKCNSATVGAQLECSTA